MRGVGLAEDDADLEEGVEVQLGAAVAGGRHHREQPARLRRFDDLVGRLAGQLRRAGMLPHQGDQPASRIHHVVVCVRAHLTPPAGDRRRGEACPTCRTSSCRPSCGPGGDDNLGAEGMSDACAHLEGADPAPAPTTPTGCEECLASASTWVHLRLCLDCGHVGCCDNSPGRHATAHYRARAPAHPQLRAGPGLVVVLCGRRRLRRRRRPTGALASVTA